MDSDEEDESYIIRAEREAKQQYLREEILELDYDPELFMAYCESIREANIDAWDFEELQDCVLNFKKNLEFLLDYTKRLKFNYRIVSN